MSFAPVFQWAGILVGFARSESIRLKVFNLSPDFFFKNFITHPAVLPMRPLAEVHYETEEAAKQVLLGGRQMAHV